MFKNFSWHLPNHKSMRDCECPTKSLSNKSLSQTPKPLMMLNDTDDYNDFGIVNLYEKAVRWLYLFNSSQTQNQLTMKFPCTTAFHFLGEADYFPIEEIYLK